MPNKVLSLARATHPGPTLAVTAVTVLLGIAIGLPPARLALLGLAVLADQVSVGLSNDWLDADRDRLTGRTDKPVALGWIDEATAGWSAFGAAGLALALTVPLGPGATITHAVFIASAWSYNLGLKNTLVSVLPYVVSFGLLPLLVTLALPVPARAMPWAMVVAALLGVAAHFANVAPDLQDDARTGIRGLPHLIGVRWGGAVTFLALAGAAVLTVVGPQRAPAAAQWAGFATTLGIAALGISLVLYGRPTRFWFRLVLAAALVDVALLATSGPRLLA